MSTAHDEHGAALRGDMFMSFGPMGLVAWIKLEAVRQGRRVSACASNNT